MEDYRYKALQNLTRARFFTVQNLRKRKAKIYKCAVQEVFYHDTGEGIQRYL